jgi:hypothetical protein
MTTIDLARHASKCLEAWVSGDIETTRSLLSDDVTVHGPFGNTEGADACVDDVVEMGKGGRGVALKRLVVEGDDVCIMYDLVSDTAGAVPSVGWYHFRDDKIDSIWEYFDPRNLKMGGRPNGSAKPLDMPFFAAGLQLCEQSD